MPKQPDDKTYLARLQADYARWRSLPAYGPLRSVLQLSSRDGVAKVLERLRQAGYLDRTPDHRWTPTSQFFQRPVAETAVPAGLPMPGSEAAGEACSIDAWLVRNPSRTTLIPITGDSMIDAGIQEGDLAVVERDSPARPGDLVIAVLNNELTLKTLAVENGAVILRPANPNYPVLYPGDNLEIFGLVIGLIRSYRSPRR